MKQAVRSILTADEVPPLEGRAMDEAAAKELGFRDTKEFFFCVSWADIRSPEGEAAFDRWQNDDGTKRGLLRAFPELQRLQRAGDISGDDYLTLEAERVELTH